MLDLLSRQHAQRMDDVTRLREPKGPTRRRFLQGLVAAGGALATGLPTWMTDIAGAVTPLGSTEGAVVLVTLLGGNDGLSTLVPIAGADRARYESLRPNLAIPPSSLIAVGDGSWGLHGGLAKLAGRYAAGNVAVVRGIGTSTNLSHFASRGTMWAGTSGTSTATGWLGRYADGLTDWSAGFREVAIGGVAPLSLVGSRVEVTALPSTGAVWGADQTYGFERRAYEALRAMAATPTGLGQWADAVAASTKDALDRAGQIAPFYGADLPTTEGLVRDLSLAAGVLNAGVGTRCITVDRDGFDTHAQQAAPHSLLLAELDAGLEAFFAKLAPSLRRQVVVVVVSEFGRRPVENSSRGTDHGAGGLAFVIGDNVRGGLYGASPSLTALDPSGNLVPSVDVRSLYRSVLEPWLGGDGRAVLGGTYEDLRLFTAGPGVAPG